VNRVRFIPALCASLFLLFAPIFGQAEEEKAEEPAAPGEVIGEVTDTLLSYVKENDELIKTKPETYFTELRGILEPAIDFESIAKSVMGKKSWTSVEEKDQQRFVEAFTDSLVQTYGKAMSSFVDLDINVAKTWPSDNPKKKSYFVQQDVKLESGLAHIVYSMHPVAEGWKVRNVTIRDSKGYKLNMGKTFNSQFKHALSENEGNVVATIDGWGKQ